MFQAIYAEQDGLAIPQLKRSVQSSCYYEGKDLFPSNMTDATQTIEHSSRSSALKVCKSLKKNDSSKP